MIEAKELRIGNWVFNKARERKQLKEVYADCSVYDPIPITEEWLLKIDAIIPKYFKNKPIIKTSRLSIVLDFLSEECSVWDDSTEEFILLPIKILYVHQLQNLHFALTGKEL